MVDLFSVPHGFGVGRCLHHISLCCKFGVGAGIRFQFGRASFGNYDSFVRPAIGSGWQAIRGVAHPCFGRNFVNFLRFGHERFHLRDLPPNRIFAFTRLNRNRAVFEQRPHSVGFCGRDGNFAGFIAYGGERLRPRFRAIPADILGLCALVSDAPGWNILVHRLLRGYFLFATNYSFQRLVRDFFFDRLALVFIRVFLFWFHCAQYGSAKQIIGTTEERHIYSLSNIISFPKWFIGAIGYGSTPFLGFWLVSLVLGIFSCIINKKRQLLF